MNKVNKKECYKKRVKKEASITARCTLEQKEQIKKMTEDLGVSESDFIMEKCFPDVAEKKKTITALRKRQEFVNQINRMIEGSTERSYEDFIDVLKVKIIEEERDIHDDVKGFRK
jgi:uncharacterized protein (DUF1778 family)